MSEILEIEMPEDVLLSLQKDKQQLAKEIRFAAAVKWYEMGLLTQGQAAEAAGLSRAAFISELARFGASPLQETIEEAIQTFDDLRS